MARPKKTQYFKLRPYKNSAGTKPNGERVRKNYSDEEEAILAMADLEADLEGHAKAAKMHRTRLSPEELASAEAAILAASGRDICAIVSNYLALESRVRNKEVDLNTTLAFVESHYRSEVRSITVLNAQREIFSNTVTPPPAPPGE